MSRFKRATERLAFGVALVSTTLLAGCSQPFNQLQSEQAQIVEVRADAIWMCLNANGKGM